MKTIGTVLGMIFFLIGQLSLAQNQIKLKQSKNIQVAHTDGELIGVVESKNNGEAIRFYKKKIVEQSVISKNHFSGRKMPIAESAFFFENGQKTMLPHNEEIAHFNLSSVCTVKHDWVADEVVVNSYDLNNGSLSNKHSRTFEHAEITAVFLKNGYLVVADAIEGSGTTLEFFNESLDPITTYEPMGGYSFYSVDCNKDNLVLAAGTSPNLNLAILNKKTGNTKAEKVISIPGFSISQVFAFENSIVLYGINSQFQNYILCYDLSLNQMWTKQALMAQNNQGAFCLTNVDQNKFFYVTASLNSSKQVAFKVICIDASTGTELWSYDILNNGQDTKSFQGYNYRGFYVTGVDYMPERKSLIVTASSLFKSNESPHRFEYLDGRLIILNEQGNAQENSILSGGKPFILRKEGKLRIVSKENTYLYE